MLVPLLLLLLLFLFVVVGTCVCVLRIFQTIRFDTLGSGAKSNEENENEYLEEWHYNTVLRRSVVFFMCYYILESHFFCIVVSYTHIPFRCICRELVFLPLFWIFNCDTEPTTMTTTATTTRVE